MSDTRVRVRTRAMNHLDVPDVLSIERSSFDRPWGANAIYRALRMRGWHSAVADVSDRVVGFVVWRHHGRRFEVLDIAVDPAYRRCGVGSQIVDLLARKLPEPNDGIVTLVRETNLGAQLFLRDRGFLAVETVRGHYEDTGEDAYLMRYRPGGPALEARAKDRGCEGF